MKVEDPASGRTWVAFSGRWEAWGLAVVLALVFLFLASPAYAQGPTGGVHTTGAVPDGTCWQCHRQPNTSGANGIAAANALCQDCHAKADTIRQVNGRDVPLQVSANDFGKTRHVTIACISCHTEAARSPHKETAAAGCSDCHSNLAKHVALGDAHLNVECAACHFQTDSVTLAPDTNQVVVSRINSQAVPVGRTNHALVSPVPCERCHTRGNTVRAAAMTLPPKDITCIGCHTSAPVIGSPISWLATAIFLIGLAFSASVWLAGSMGGKTTLTLMEKLSLIVERAVGTVFSRRLWLVIKTAFLDGILHRRILKESIARWVAHSLILLPFFARFALGLVTGVAVQFYPNAELTRVLVDRDSPGVAFTNDFLALLILIGAGYAGYLRATDKQRRALTAGQDTLALVLLGLIFIFGFVVEGAHIVVAQIPWGQAWYALGGAAVAAVLNLAPLDWPTIYPFLFYMHAILVTAFVAYLPFSKFFHIIVSLFVVAIRPALQEEKALKSPRVPQSS